MSTSVTEAVGMTVYRAGSNAPVSAESRVRGAQPQPTFTANGYSGLVSWDDGGAGGTFAPFGVNNNSAVYTPKNKTQAVTIYATDSVNTHFVAITTFATVPLQPQVGFETEFDIDTKVKFAKDRTRYFREDGSVEVGWVLGWERRQTADKLELEQFWFDHRKVNQFYMVDVEGNIQNKVWFVSSLKSTYESNNRWSMAASVRGSYENIQASAVELANIQINCGGYAVPPYIQDRYFTSGYTYYYGAITPDVSGVTSPAPTEVYKWVRYDGASIGYLVTGLRANKSHTVRVHYMTDTQARTVHPIIQGTSQSNVVMTVGYVVTTRTYTVTSDVRGQISVRIDYVSGPNATVSAIEVVEV